MAGPPIPGPQPRWPRALATRSDPVPNASISIENDEMWTETETSTEQILVHLVNLPRVGFTHTLLAKRMLQWKRMGFDLVALEPALSMNDMQVAHSLYTEVEQQITKAIDLLRLLAANVHLFTVTEREMFHFKLMHLSEVELVESQVQDLLSTR